MPVIETTLIEGYDDATKDRLSRALHHAARSVIAAPTEGVTVILREVPASNYRRGGAAKTPGPPRPDAVEVVRTFLARMEARDLYGAKALVADGFRMVFPGDRRFATFEELMDWAKDRYAWVKKTHERFDAAPAEDGVAVTCFGTLYGEGLDGAPFEGIRYVDWFLVVDGKITRQHVWNDMAEVRG
jgi:phenylpyruvate tautomerase PptA (4-oxalocrotonate tautomerase family)/ketosteroid isomerase-like protein